MILRLAYRMPKPNLYSIVILRLAITASSECFIGDYRGTLSQTVSGIICQRWDNWWPHIPDESHRIGSEHANYCRNPNGSDFTWCYTTDLNIVTERCGLTKCERTTEGKGNLVTSTEKILTTTGKNDLLFVDTSPTSTNNLTITQIPTTSIFTKTTTSCSCPCSAVSSVWFNYFYGNLTDTEKNEILRKEKEKIRKELVVDEKGLSSYIRKKTCAKDNRPVAISMGTTIGIGIIVSVVILFVLADITNLPVLCCTKKLSR